MVVVFFKFQKTNTRFSENFSKQEKNSSDSKPSSHECTSDAVQILQRDRGEGGNYILSWGRASHLHISYTFTPTKFEVMNLLSEPYWLMTLRCTWEIVSLTAHTNPGICLVQSLLWTRLLFGLKASEDKQLVWTQTKLPRIPLWCHPLFLSKVCTVCLD